MYAKAAWFEKTKIFMQCAFFFWTESSEHHERLFAVLLSPYFAKPHEDCATIEKDEKFRGDEMSPDVGRNDRGKL